MNKTTGFYDKKQVEILVGAICYYDDADIELVIIEEDGKFYAKPSERGMDKELLEDVAKWLRVIY